MAKITYLFEGENEGTSRITIDGEYIDSSNFVGLCDNNIHAIQWDGSKGEIEYKDDTPNKIIDDISSFAFEDKFNAEKVIIAKAEEQAKKDELQAIEDAKATWTYSEKRKNEYPNIEDQLDDIYHNGIDGWKTTIKAIKDKYPK